MEIGAVKKYYRKKHNNTKNIHKSSQILSGVLCFKSSNAIDYIHVINRPSDNLPLRYIKIKFLFVYIQNILSNTIGSYIFYHNYETYSTLKWMLF